jgi:branched-chain amino acid transport system permease protein
MTTSSVAQRASAHPFSVKGFQAIRFAVLPAAVWLTIGVIGVGVLDTSHLFLGTTAVVYALFALSNNILLGWAGMTSFGQAAFFGVGAYSAALLTTHISSPILLLLAGAGIAAVVASLFGIVATRVHGVQFAMLTLVFGQILWLVLYRVPGLGGEAGIAGIPRGILFGQSLFVDQAFWWFAVVVVMVCTIVLLRIRESSWGTAVTTVRDSPRRAAALGIDTRRIRITAFTAAGVFAGIAGVMYTQLQGIASPGVMSWTLSGEVIIMCLLGGLHHFWGPIIGAAVFTYGKWALTDSTSAWELWLGLVLLVVVVALPKGLSGLIAGLKPWVRRLSHNAMERQP